MRIRRHLALVALALAAPVLAGCTQPTPAGWTTDPATGLSWRPMSGEEVAAVGYDPDDPSNLEVRGWATEVGADATEPFAEDREVVLEFAFEGEVLSIRLVFEGSRNSTSCLNGDCRETTCRRYDGPDNWRATRCEGHGVQFSAGYEAYRSNYSRDPPTQTDVDVGMDHSNLTLEVDHYLYAVRFRHRAYFG